MIGLRQIVLSVLPGPLHSALQPWWRRFFRLRRRVSEWWVPLLVWMAWGGFQWPPHGWGGGAVGGCVFFLFGWVGFFSNAPPMERVNFFFPGGQALKNPPTPSKPTK